MGADETVVADDGTRLWATRAGAEAPVLLCHGGPGLWDFLGGLAGLLADRFAVHRWDQRGCGRSQRRGPYASPGRVARCLRGTGLRAAPGSIPATTRTAARKGWEDGPSPDRTVPSAARTGAGRPSWSCPGPGSAPWPHAPGPVPALTAGSAPPVRPAASTSSGCAPRRSG
ncbi:alpha/beta fold hydrolase [Actinacidiphila reveromycinica]|uniref:alpha/beta fold hydrolase n=1 Tax=Actinacidiphila reveromycinica TaxID=659352 RepID=UPI003211B4E4